MSKVSVDPHSDEQRQHPPLWIHTRPLSLGLCMSGLCMSAQVVMEERRLNLAVDWRVFSPVLASYMFYIPILYMYNTLPT